MDGETEPYLFSGCVVQFEGKWLWITAAHCADTILEIYKLFPSASSAFVSLANPNSEPVVIPKSDIKFVNMQEIIRGYKQRWPDSDIDSTDIELFDLAFIVLSDLVHCYLLNLDVDAIPSALATLTPEDVLARIGSKSILGLFVAGVPEESHSIDRTTSRIRFEFKVMPLHLDPDDSPDLSERREVKSLGQFTWIPTNWEHTEWNTHVRGLSGGPVFLRIDENIFLQGIATQQDPPPYRSPKYIGVTSVKSTIDILNLVKWAF